MSFNPNPGPQTRAYDSEADITGYGGAAGGGKSFLEIGLAVTQHRRSIIFRREAEQTRDLWQKLSDVCGSAGRSNENLLVWRDLPGERYVRLAGCKNPGDWKKFQGQAHDLYCVVAGTPVRMGDGTYCPIEKIRVGDFVATLEGPRRVTRTLRMGVRDTVRVTARVGEESFTQIQSVNHPLLTNDGWVSHDTLREPHQPENVAATERPDAGRFGTPLSSIRASARLHLGASGSGLALLSGLPQSGPDRPDWPACCAGTARIDRGSGFVASVSEPRDGGPLASALQTAPGLSRHPDGLGAFGSYPPASAHDALGEPCSTGQPDSPEHCSFAPRRRGEHALPSGVVARVCPQQPDDAARRIPNDSGDGDRDRTPTRTRHTASWVHPYTKEIRQTQAALEEAPLTFAPAGRQEVFDLTVDSANHYITGSVGLINRNCFDEATEFLESQVRTLIAWNRTTIPDQRCRVVLAFNPPTTPEGEWIIQFFAAWLDETHPNPAEPGELRWYATIDGDDIECPDGEPFEHICTIHDGEIIQPRSRTFFPARLEDNPLLEATGYRSQLQGLPEPLRSQMLYGDFTVGIQDDPWQVIPTSWVRAAQARWSEDGKQGDLSQIGFDVAQGGADNTVIARRYGAWFATLEVIPGVDTPDANVNAGHVARAMAEGGAGWIDADGIGASTYFLARAQMEDARKKAVHAYQGSQPTDWRDKARVLDFVNTRAAAWWSLREALDPSSEEPIALPPSRELRVELCSPKWEKLATGVKIEPKKDIKARLGRSTDLADAVVMAWWGAGRKNIAVPKTRPVVRGDAPFEAEAWESAQQKMAHGDAVRKRKLDRLFKARSVVRG